ncbi:MAG: hypothetical protein H0X26_09160 [Alphaproteobacteria bacterium]|nr:hypothetical protein [Alphaproteobacteria bacterium]
MGEFLKKLMTGLNQICPTFTQTPPQTPYPYITLEVEQKLSGLPWGPFMVIVTAKIWSRYPGTQEILKLAKEAEGFLHARSFETSLKLLESTLVLLNDGQTRVHSFRLKARVMG